MKLPVRLCLLSMLLYVLPLWSQEQSFPVLEYRPAPGQLINTSWGRLPDAFDFSANTGGSLGSFGGTVVFHCLPPIENHAGNPYGVDFTLLGNPLETWSEPGAVWVMKDVNGNGQPDDTWYLLAGADYYFSTTGFDTLTYYRNGDTSEDPVSWIDSNGDTGYIYRNSFHLQEYYPSPAWFPHHSVSPAKYSGLRLGIQPDLTDPAAVRLQARAFGFADNRTVENPAALLPDNPYTPAPEGSGGDAMDISWAVDREGKPVLLDTIDFIKVQTAVSEYAGPLGEVSTEITGILDVAPADPGVWEDESLVMEDLPSLAGVGSRIPLKGYLFKRGKPVEEASLQWSLRGSAATINAGDTLTGLTAGMVDVVLTASAAGNLETEWKVAFVQPEYLSFHHPPQVLRAGEAYKLKAIVYDGSQRPLSGIKVHYTVSDPEMATIGGTPSEKWLLATATGEVTLYATVQEYPEICDSLKISLLPEAGYRKVWLSIRTPNRQVFGHRSLMVENKILSPFFRDPGDWDDTETSGFNLLHVLSAPFSNEPFSGDLRFDMDYGVFLYRVPYYKEGYLEYYYGYGSPEPASGTWLIRHQDDFFVNQLEIPAVREGDHVRAVYTEQLEEGASIPFLHLSADTLQEDESLEVRLEEVLLEWTGAGQVRVAESVPLDDASLKVDDVPFQKRTDDNGYLHIDGLTPGEHVLSWQNLKAYFYVTGATLSSGTSPGKPLLLYPNPASERIHWNSKVPVERICITGIEGQVFWDRKAEGAVPVWQLAPGMYFVRFYFRNGYAEKKLIVE